MRKKILNATISEESYLFIEKTAKKIGQSRSYAIDLLIDTVAGNMGEDSILKYYNTIFKHNRLDGRKKNGS